MQEERLTVLRMIQNNRISAVEGKNLLAALARDDERLNAPGYAELRKKVLAWLELDLVNAHQAEELVAALNDLAADLDYQLAEAELNEVLQLKEERVIEAKVAAQIIYLLKELIVHDPSAARRTERLEILSLVRKNKLTGTTALDLLDALNPRAERKTPAAAARSPERDDFIPLEELRDVGSQISQAVREEISKVMPNLSPQERQRASRERERELERELREREREARRAEKEARKEQERVRKAEERARRDAEKAQRGPSARVDRGYDVRSIIQDEVQRALTEGRRAASSLQNSIVGEVRTQPAKREKTSLIDPLMDRLHDRVRELDIAGRAVEQNWESLNRTPSPINFDVLLQRTQASLSVIHQKLAAVSEANDALELHLSGIEEEERSIALELLEHAKKSMAKHKERLTELEAGVAELSAVGEMRHDAAIDDLRGGPKHSSF